MDLRSPRSPAPAWCSRRVIVAGALAIVRVPFGPALLTGAILSATDPIAVVAVFRRLKVPRTLATIVECESLFNDAVAVALYREVLVAIALGAVSGECDRAGRARDVWRRCRRDRVRDCMAFVVARAPARAADAAIQIAATIVCAYGAYFAADCLRLSGIFATIACGIALRYYERRWITLSIAEDVNRFWDVAALLANALVFFMVGAALQIGRVAREPVFTVACIAAIALARVVVAGLLLPGPYPREWVDMVRVAGMRGGLSLALALAIPACRPLSRGDYRRNVCRRAGDIGRGAASPIVPAVRRVTPAGAVRTDNPIRCRAGKPPRREGGRRAPSLRRDFVDLHARYEIDEP